MLEMALTETDTDTLLQQLDTHLQAMPPVKAMALTIENFDGERLRLRAPLLTHVNDKGCAFGGSLVSLLTLAGWGLVTLKVQQAGLKADVFVADSQVRYLAPLYDDLRAEAWAADDQSWDDFIQTLRSRGRARIHVTASVPLPDSGVATSAQSRYVAIATG